MIRIENLVKRYGSFTAVNGLNLEVPQGCIYGFVGPNGAGKTTTMRILATLLKPTSGMCEIAGVNVSQNPYEARKALGYMPDFFGVYRNLTSLEYLDFYGDAQGMGVKERKKAAEDLLELVMLSDKRDNYVDTLSRGMTQRLCLARALMHDPQVLLLDEPASGMDPRARAEMKGILRTLQGMGKTILISSHILPELAELCSMVGILSRGKLRAAGSTAQIAAMMGVGAVLEVRLTARADESAAWARQNPFVTAVERQDDLVRIRFAGDDEAIVRLLNEMVSEGFPVIDFHRAESSLEQLFLEVTSENEAS